MKEEGLLCWNCGRPTGVTGSVTRNDQCQNCVAELRSCRGCRHFDPTRRGQCRENIDRTVANKDKAKKEKPKKNPTNGVKSVTWWPFIPMDHFIVPLLHCLIGVGDNMFTRFRDIVNEKIEYLSPEEVYTRLAVGAMEGKIGEIRAELDAWKKSTDGKEYISLDAKIRRAKKSLKRLNLLNNISGVASTADNSPNQDFLQEVTAFIEEGGDAGVSDDGDDVEPECDQAANASSATEESTGELSDLQKEINDVKKKLDESQKKYDSLKEKRVELFEDPLKKGKAYLKMIKSKISNSKSEHRKDGDGIEAKLFLVLKIKYGVKIQAYHGGTMNGKDIQKVMENASAIFTKFANILKANKKQGCELCNECIDAL